MMKTKARKYIPIYSKRKLQNTKIQTHADVNKISKRLKCFLIKSHESQLVETKSGKYDVISLVYFAKYLGSSATLNNT